MPISKHEFLIIKEDMHAHIGKDGNNKFCLLNLSNRNGKYLTRFSLKNRHVYLPKKEGMAMDLLLPK